MWSRADIAKDLVQEIDAFLFHHRTGERQFLIDLGTNTNLIRNLRAGGSITTETIGRLRDRMTAVDPGWRLRNDWRDQVVFCAESYAAHPSEVNRDALLLAVACLNRWPLSP